MSTATAVCDGWDVRAILANGDTVTLHFGREPGEQEIAAAQTAYETALAEAGIEVETETGEIVREQAAHRYQDQSWSDE